MFHAPLRSHSAQRCWVGYFGLARQFEDIANLDGWLKRRIRMCYWKQWRYPRTKIKHLVALGVTLDMAVKHAIRRKKHWRMSGTPALRFAMTNEWLCIGSLRATRLGVIKATLV
jgi:RNA-directed DNA polymerase